MEVPLTIEICISLSLYDQFSRPVSVRTLFFCLLGGNGSNFAESSTGAFKRLKNTSVRMSMVKAQGSY